MALGAGAAATAERADAFSQDYAGYVVNYGTYAGHGNYNSIIYNRSTSAGPTGNACVYMVTAAGNLRAGGAVICAVPGSNQGRMCVASATPMSEGRTTPLSSDAVLYGVVNNTTYDSGCAV